MSPGEMASSPETISPSAKCNFHIPWSRRQTAGQHPST